MQRLTALLLPCPCPCSPPVNQEETRMRPLDDHQQVVTPTVDTPPMTLHPPMHNVIVIQVDGGSDGDELPDVKDDNEPDCPMEVIVRAVSETDDSEPSEMQCETVSADNRLPETLLLSVLDFNNAYNLFKVRRRAITGHLTGLQDRRLHRMKDSPDHPGRDRGLLLLDGSLVNLKELQLTDLTIGDETFDMIRCNFPRLTRLTVSNCKTREQEHHVAFESHYGLEELVVREVNLTNEIFRRILPSLNKLRVLKLFYCNVNDEILAAIVTHLPHLTCLEVTPSSNEDVTDAGLEGLIDCRPNMTELCLENVQLMDTGLQKITHCMPNLRRLKVASANIGDDTVTTVADLNGLRMLELRGTRATDDGLTVLARRLGQQLEELHLESGSITECGMRQALSDLAPSLRFLTIDCAESTKRICFQGEESSSLQVNATDGDLVRAVIKRFPNVDTLTVSSSSLSAAMLEDVAPFQTKLTSLFLTGSGIDDAAILTVDGCFPRLQRLSLYETVVTSAAVGEFTQHGLTELEELNIENKEFVTSEVIIKMATTTSLLKRLRSCHMTDNKEQQSGQLTAFTTDGITDLRLGGLSIDDIVLGEVLRQYDKVERLRLKDTSVTDEGIVRAVSSSSSNLLAVRELALVSENIGDESLKCVGNCLPDLRELTLKSARVTDEGLASLNEHLVANLEIFDVSESNVTDVGVRQLVIRGMKSIRTLNVFENPNVNEGIRDFLHQQLPEMGFIVAPAPEADEQQEQPWISE